MNHRSSIMCLAVMSFRYVSPTLVSRQCPCFVSQLRSEKRAEFSNSLKRLKRYGRTTGGKSGASDDSADGFLSQDVEQLLSELSSSSSNHESSTVQVAPKENQNEWLTIDWDMFAEEPGGKSLDSHDFHLSRKESILRRLDPGDPSPVEAVMVRNRMVYLKRDDLLRLEGSNVSGNKARKLYALNEIPAHEFPDVVVSYGGPQSNAMVALAAIVHSKNLRAQVKEINSITEDKRIIELSSTPLERNKDPPASKRKRFLYYTKKLPRFLRNQPSGNFFRAKTLGMEIVELTNEEYQDLFGSESGGRPAPPTGLPPPSPKSLWVPQGGACGAAVPGARRLASEIVSFWKQCGHGRPLSVCVPGGTCATAVLLHREIEKLLQNGRNSMDIRVVVCPCVGDNAYARRQMMSLNLETGGGGTESDIPFVLAPNDAAHGKYYRFGEPHAEILDTFREMREENGVDLDLLYGAPAWNLMLQHWRLRTGSDGLEKGFDERQPLSGREIMYIHSGGLEGVTSQLLRYKYKGLVESHEIQLPGRTSNNSNRDGDLSKK